MGTERTPDKQDRILKIAEEEYQEELGYGAIVNFLHDPAVEAILAAPSATVPLDDVRKMLCERCKAGYPFYGTDFKQHIVPGYTRDTYMNCRATEKLSAFSDGGTK